MYNFNTSLSTPLLGVGVDFCSNTPRTPEILNSLIAMTNPFEYSYSSASQSQSIPSTASIMNVDTSPVIACKTEDAFLNQQFDTSSSSSSLESPGTTPLHLSSAVTTPSLQQTRSQLIKAGVKLLIQNKRKNSGSSSFDYDCKPPPLKIRPTTLSTSPPTATRLNSSCSIPSSFDTVPSPTTSTSTLTSPKQESSPISVRSFPTIKTDDTTSCDEDSEPKRTVNSKNLTPEDEDRRRRRRERNKIAATKCRLKKRECINNLMRESDTLESQNVDLKSQLKSLEEEFKYLSEMWQSHQLECKSMALLGSQTVTSNEQNNNSNASLVSSLFDEIEMIKDTNNNKHLHNQDQNSQLPSLTPLINCNVSFDFY